ncbi:MAG: ABC transporter substrate-binding protein [Polyangiaceae bacterium]|nr:ABC transporter substrate-binding protein [Polyangiaceae bacterium]
MSLRGGVLALVVAIAAGCGGESFPVPQPDYGLDLSAQRDLSHMRSTWERADHDGRMALEEPLTGHVSKYPADPSARVARSMLALIALEKGDTERALSLATPLAAGREGTTRDAALVVLGALDRRKGHSAEALARLAPLFQKVIDPVAKSFLNRELVLAAIDTARFEQAARYLQAYVRQSGAEDRQKAGTEAATLLEKIPPKPLLSLLSREQGGSEPDPVLLQILTQHLARVAVEKEDVALAKTLLEVAGPLLGDGADDVARIAARGAAVRLERNTVGLVLPLRSEELRRRGVEVAAGLALALELPGGRARLVTRDDQGDVASVDDALALLNADGAAVIVAGFDSKEADMASAYGERTGVPVLLLRPPSRPPKDDGPVFVMGESPAEARSLLARALAERGHSKVAVIASDRDGNDKTVAEPNVVGVQQCGASLDFVKTAGADALVVDGGPRCAAEAGASATGNLALAFGLDGGAVERRGFYASAGQFPFSGASTQDPLLAAWFKGGRGDPTWWNALGHDAGMLAKQAVLSLPADTDDTDDAKASQRRKNAAIKAVAEARAQMWTTEAQGFGGKRTIARTIKVLDRGAPSARPGRTKPTR